MQELRLHVLSSRQPTIADVVLKGESHEREAVAGWLAHLAARNDGRDFSCTITRRRRRRPKAPSADSIPRGAASKTCGPVVGPPISPASSPCSSSPPSIPVSLPPVTNKRRRPAREDELKEFSCHHYNNIQYSHNYYDHTQQQPRKRRGETQAPLASSAPLLSRRGTVLTVDVPHPANGSFLEQPWHLRLPGTWHLEQQQQQSGTAVAPPDFPPRTPRASSVLSLDPHREWAQQRQRQAFRPLGNGASAHRPPPAPLDPRHNPAYLAELFDRTPTYTPETVRLDPVGRWSDHAFVRPVLPPLGHYWNGEGEANDAEMDELLYTLRTSAKDGTMP